MEHHQSRSRPVHLAGVSHAPDSPRRGDRFQHIQPGGGGFGSPLERDPEMVLDAVDNEMITPEYAFDVYGVVIDGRTVDHEATAERRGALAASPADETAHLRHFHQAIGIDPGERPQS